MVIPGVWLILDPPKAELFCLGPLKKGYKGKTKGSSGGPGFGKMVVSDTFRHLFGPKHSGSELEIGELMGRGSLDKGKGNIGWW